MTQQAIITRLKQLIEEKRVAMEGTVCHYWRHAAKIDGEITNLIEQLVLPTTGEKK